MSKRNCLTLALCLACVSALAACGASDGNSNTANSSNATGAANANRAAATPASADTPAPAASPASSPAAAAAGDKIGVAECDDYLAKLDSCVTGKVPEAARAQYRAGMEQTRSSWRSLAANPQTRGALVSACKTAAESARATYKAYGCEF